MKYVLGILAIASMMIIGCGEIDFPLGGGGSGGGNNGGGSGGGGWGGDTVITGGDMGDCDTSVVDDDWDANGDMSGDTCQVVDVEELWRSRGCKIRYDTTYINGDRVIRTFVYDCPEDEGGE